uniref:PDE4_UCR domain-containing protein n=1 Tax=Mesocestoides corti TaxID=53468 RepID=A0A5K3FSP6_MESCO
MIGCSSEQLIGSELLDASDAIRGSDNELARRLKVQRNYASDPVAPPPTQGSPCRSMSPASRILNHRRGELPCSVTSPTDSVDSRSHSVEVMEASLSVL